MTRSMQRRLFSLVTASGFGLSLSALATAQDAPVLPPPAPDNAPAAAPPAVEGNDEFETLTRGPVHEAFAEQYNADPVEGLIVPKAPPEAIDELPPDQMPEGNNVEWVPGYWGWDDEREDYIWISGLWRDIPPGQRWVPGYWTEATGGYQWVSGFWTGEDTAELNYIQQPPPASLEQGPNIESPGDDQFWVPGSWQYVEEDYRWRPGYYAPVYDQWVWIPDRFVWSPFGYVFCPGYWDYRLPSRGVMFAPVHFRHASWWHFNRRPFTPGLVLDVGPLTLHWFVRPSYRHYYFGDFYAAHYYSNWGVQPWYSCQFGFGGFGGFRHRRHCHYDPLLVFYSGYHRRHHRIDYRDRLSNWHRHYRDNEDFRPRRTAREQDAFIAAHEHGDERHKEVVKNVRLSRKLDEYAAQPADRDQHFVKLDETERDRRGKESKKIRDVAQMRHDVEVADGVVRVDRADRSGRNDRDDAVVGNDPSNRDQGNEGPGSDSSNRDRNNGRDRNDRSGTPGDVADVTIPGTGDDASTPNANRDTKQTRKLQLPEVEKKTDRTREPRGVVGAPQDPPGQTGNDSGLGANDRTRDARRTERSFNTDRNNNSNNNSNRTPGVDTGTPGATFPDGVTGDSRNRSTREGNSGNSNNNSNNSDRNRQPRTTTRDQGGNNSGPAIVPTPTQPGSAIPDSGNSSNRNRNTRQQQRDTNSGSSFQSVPRSNQVPNNSGNSGSNRSNRSGSNSNRSGSNQSGSFQSVPNNSAPSGDTRSRSNSSRSNSGSFNSGSNNSNRSNSGSFNSGSRSNRSSNSGSFNSGSNRSSNSGSFNSGSRSSRQSGNSGSRSGSGGRKGNK